MKTLTHTHTLSPLKYFTVILIHLMILCKPIIAQTGTPLTLVLDGVPNDCTIVLDVNATNAAKLAAYELKHYIERISGASLNIAPDGIGTGYTNRILVGESEATRNDYGYFASDFAFNEYLIEVRNSSDHNDLILMGWDDTIVNPDFDENEYDKDFWHKERWGEDDIAGVGAWNNPDHLLYRSLGSVYAVHTFLEQFLQVRWYLPTADYEVYPNQPVITINPVSKRLQPLTKYRSPSRWRTREPFSFHSPNKPYVSPVINEGTEVSHRDNLLWHLRMKMGGEYIAVNHGFNGYSDTYCGEAYEDWWKTQGEDGCANYSPAHPNYHLQAFIDQVAVQANNYLVDGITPDDEGTYGDQAVEKMVYGNKTFSVVPLDAMENLMWAPCSDGSADCSGWRDTQKGKSSTPAYGSGEATRFVLEFTNKIAAQVTEPDTWITQAAYSGYMLAPDPGTVIEPNILIKVADNLTKGISIEPEIWDFYAGNQAAWNNLLGAGRLYTHQWYLTQSQNDFRYFPTIYPRHIAKAIKYMHSQNITGMQWEDSAGTQPGKTYTDNRLANPAEDLLNLYITKKFLVDPSLDVTEVLNEFYALFFGPAEPYMKNFFSLIESRWNDPARWDEANSSKDESWEIMGLPGVLDQLGSFIDQALQATTPADPNDPADPMYYYHKRVDLFNQAVYMEMRLNAQHFENSSTGIPRSLVNHTLTPPDITNGVKDSVWDLATESGPFRMALGENGDVKTTARLLRDDNALYILITNYNDPLPAAVTTIHDDEAIFDDDVMEIALDCPRDRTGYYHVVINTAGAVYDRRVDEAIDLVSDTPDPELSEFTEDLSWESSVESEVYTVGNGWAMEIKVPFSSIGIAGLDPINNDVWGLNIVRRMGADNPSHFLVSPFITPQEDVKTHLYDSDLYAIITFSDTGITADGFPAPVLYYGFNDPAFYDFSAKEVYDQAENNWAAMEKKSSEIPLFSEAENIQPGKNGNGFWFYGGDAFWDGHYLDLVRDPIMMNTERDDYTIALWVKAKSPGSLVRTLTSSPLWSLTVNSAGKLNFIIKGSGMPTTNCGNRTGKTHILDESGLEDWVHVVAMVERGRTVRLYVDGALAESCDISYHKGETKAGLFIGDGQFEGMMDELYIFRGTYGQELVDRLYSEPENPVLP